MKKTGNTSDFKEDRDRDLMQNFIQVLKTATDTPLREMFGLAAARPARRFWVSEDRAAIVIGAMRRGDVFPRMFPKRREMYQEIYRRVLEKMKNDPNLCLTHAVNQTVYEEAPSFYLTDESARSIIYRIRERNRKRRAVLKAINNGKL